MNYAISKLFFKAGFRWLTEDIIGFRFKIWNGEDFYWVELDWSIKDTSKKEAIKYILYHETL